MKRFTVNKSKSAKTFRNKTRRTKAANLMPMRGGWRL